MAILGSRGIPASYGGFETFAEELSTRLVTRGFDVTVYCESGNAEEQASTYAGVKLVHLTVPELGPLSTIVFDAKCLWHARRAYDVVYMLGYGASLFLFLPRIFSTEVWVNMDGIEWIRSKWNPLARLWLRSMESVAMWSASTIVADAAGIKDHLEDRHTRRDGIVVIPYGAKIVSEAPNESPLGEFDVTAGDYYLVVCRLEPENHIVEIVEGYILSNTAFPLIVVGDIEADTPYVERLRLVSDARVKFVGTVFDQEKLTCLRWHCRAYFHGHSVGGTNPSLLEALGCGNRVVVHENRFNREVAAGCAQYFTDASDIKAIIRRLDASPADDASRQKSYRRINDAYTWQHIVNEYVQLMT